MKKILLSLLLLPALSFGQARFGLIDSMELEKMQKAASPLSATAHGEETLTFFMRVDGDAAASRVEAAGAIIEQREGNILVVSSPLSQAERIAATEGVVTVSLSKQYHYNAVNAWGDDLSREKSGLNNIRNAVAPLTQDYTGEGVVVGVVDLGIDPHHKAFLNDDGTHRVKTIWKHQQMGQANITITSDTEEKISKFLSDNSAATHGTHVMGIAAGSFNPADGPDFRGGAPGAEIVVSCGTADNARLLKGLRSIVDYAKAQNKPCVINMSLGNNSGPHDGTDEFPAALNAIAGEDNVTVFVSAGNEGSYKAFLYKEFGPDDTGLKTIISPSDYTAYLYPSSLAFFPQACGDLEIWSDDETPFNIYLDLLKIDGTKAEVIKSFPMPESGIGHLATSDMPDTGADFSAIDDETFNTVYRKSYVRTSSGVYAGNGRFRTEMAFMLECNQSSYLNAYFVAIRIEGKEGHRLYAYGGSTNGVFPFELHSRNIEGYTVSTGDGSINALAGAENVITVGSYVTHNFVPSSLFGYARIGTTANYTSWGLTPDGRKHPMINAPGTLIVSAMSTEYYEGSSYSPDVQPVYYTYKDANGKSYQFTPMSGTSMASPYMAGVAAAWLSADPTLTREDILRIAQESSDTPAVKKKNDGASGHLNAFRGLCQVLGLDGIGNVKADKDLLDIKRSGDTFTILCSNDNEISAEFHNLQGAAVLSKTGRGSELTVDASALANGIYILSVKAGNAVKTIKTIINQ